jgi:predicted metal-dependent hydrolase
VPDLPAYAVRESARARKVRLTVSARDGLVVVVPASFPRRQIPLIVAERRAWIERALERVREHREALAAQRESLPERVELPGVGESWEIVYVPSLAQGVRAVARGDTLRLTGAVSDRGAVDAALRRFGRARAAEVLPRMLAEVSAEQGLPFSAVKVRNQRTRWGSCSARGSINLNWTLAFLPAVLARHVMLHELVHTLRLDHSPRFRSLLLEREPDTVRLARELRTGYRHVPAWASDGY